MEEDISDKKKDAPESGLRDTKRSLRFWLALSGLIFLIALVLTSAVFLLLYKKSPAGENPLMRLSKKWAGETVAESTTETREDLPRRLLDGVYVEEGQENLYPMAVVIDNHPDARPSAGLARANLVIEAPVEGATTRFLAVYADSEEIAEIGPIRSARPYFLDWTSELSAGFFHCGGSPAALALIARNNINDINEFYKGYVFWRAQNRRAPHNVMSSTEKMRDYLGKKNDTEGKFLSWIFKDDSPIAAATGTASEISVPDYGAAWRYGTEGNDYSRLIGGRVVKDADGSEIRAKNVIILFTVTKVLDDLLRLEITTIGQDKAVICIDGACQAGEWRKASASARTRFYAANGDEIAFNAGPTWIEVVDINDEVKY